MEAEVGFHMRLFCSIILAILLISSMAFSAAQFTPCFHDDQFIADGLLHLASADMNGDGKDELLLVGRDYIDPQASMYVLDTSPGKPVTVWQTPNMMEQNSPVLLAVGKFTDTKLPQAAVVTNHRLTLFGWGEAEGYHQILSVAHNIAPWEITAVDWNQDGLDEFVVTRAVRNDETPVKRIEVYQLIEGSLKLLAVSPPLGNIRSLAAGDLNGDGIGEIVVEVGKVSQPGTYFVFKAGQTSWTPILGPVKLVKAAVYGMAIAPIDGRPALLTASERGKASIFRWNDGNLEPDGEMSFSAGLVSITAGTFWPGRTGIAVLAYPQTFHLLQEGEAK